MDDGSGNKKAKGTKKKKKKKRKKSIIKRILKFKGYKKCLQNDKIILKLQQRFKSKAHNLFIEEINKIALSITMLTDYRLLIESHHIHMVQMLEKYAKQSCWDI